MWLRKDVHCLIALWSMLISASPPLSAQGNPVVTRVQGIALSGVEGRIDHMSADRAGKRLFVAALGNNTVEVVDLDDGKRRFSLSGFRGPQGIAFSPSDYRLLIANAQTGECDYYDSSTYHKLGVVPFGNDADNVRYERKTDRFYVGFGNGAIGILDAASGKRVGTVQLAAHPESFQLEKHGPRIFVNIPDVGQIAVIDRVLQKVVSVWPVKGARENFPMALDETHHRLFVGCRAPAKLLVLNTQTGSLVTSFPIVGDTDDIAYDGALKRLYITGGEGYLDVYSQVTADRYTRTQHTPTAPGARTSLFVPSLQKLYIGVPHRGKQAAELLVFAVND